MWLSRATSGVVLISIAVTFSSYALWTVHSPRKRKERLRRKLPTNLDTWRIPGNCQEAEEKIWTDLYRVFRDAGFTLWPNAFCSTLKTPGLTFPLSSGFGYATSSRRLTPESGPGTVGRLRRYDYSNPLSRAARTGDGHDVIIRVIVIGNEGHEHLKILRRIAVGEISLYSDNHTLPMFAEFQFEDIIFGVFPKVGEAMRTAYGHWAKNSVGDIVDMLMQMLEALAFIHDLNIAHCDAFHDNFVVQWQPESLTTMKISPSRPRVYLVDFEVAKEFPPEYPADDCVLNGYPLGGSFTCLEMYSRPHAPEFTSGKPYSPFKLDVWQLGTSLSEFKSTITTIDEIFAGMTDTDSGHRLDAKEALDKLQKFVLSATPESLLIAPVVVEA